MKRNAIYPCWRRLSPVCPMLTRRPMYTTIFDAAKHR